MSLTTTRIEQTQEFTRHRGPVTCVAGIPHTRHVVTSAYDGAVARFDLERGDVTLLGYHDHLANRIAVHASGALAASSGADYAICLWDLTTNRLRRRLLGHADDVEDFAFISEHLGVSVSQDARVIVWNLDTGAIENVFYGHEKCILSVEHSRGRVFTSGDDMTLRMWDLESGELLRMWGPLEQEADSCAVDTLHDRTVLGCDDGKIRVFDNQSGRTVGEFPAHEAGIKKVAVSPHDGSILSSAYDQQIFVWDAESFEMKVILQSRPSVWERSFNWSPDGQQVLAGTFDGTVIAWDAQHGSVLGEYGRTDDGNQCFNEVSANDAGELVTVSDDGILRLGRLSEGESRWLHAVEPAAGRMLANAVTLDDSTGLVVAGAHNQKLHIFQWRDHQLGEEVEVPVQEGPINCVRVAHHEGYEGQVFAACYGGAIVRVDRHGAVLDRIRLHEGSVKALRLHPHRPCGVSCSADGGVVLWDFEGQLIERFAAHSCIADDVDFDPTGEYVASVSRDFSLKVFRLSDGRLLHSRPLGRRSPKAVCFFDPDTVIASNYWGALLRFDLPAETCLTRTIAGNGISSISRGGDDLIVSSYDGAVYRVSPDDLTVVGTLRAMIQRPTVGASDA